MGSFLNLTNTETNNKTSDLENGSHFPLNFLTNLSNESFKKWTLFKKTNSRRLVAFLNCSIEKFIYFYVVFM